VKKYTSKAFDPSASDLNHEAYKAGYAFFRDGSFNKARLAFEDALEYWPKDPQAWMALGNCHDAMGKPERAEKCFRRALRVCADEDVHAIRFNLANSLLDQERFAEAIDLYVTIPSESDVFVKAQRNLSRARSGSGRKTRSGVFKRGRAKRARRAAT
jgi:tetratricopeptide (TPR) repeat protein